MNRISRFRSWGIGAGLVAGLLISTVAQAHITLIESSPAADDVVASPTQIDLVFNEQLVPRASTVRLERVNEADPAGATTPHVDVQVVNGGTSCVPNRTTHWMRVPTACIGGPSGKTTTP